jgi:hypothetical protein
VFHGQKGFLFGQKGFLILSYASSYIGFPKPTKGLKEIEKDYKEKNRYF